MRGYPARAYRVVVTAEDGQWLADVPELPGAHTFARTLKALDRHVREVIVLADGLPDEAVGALQLDLEFHTGDDALDRMAARLRALRAREVELRQELTNQSAAMAHTLVHERSWSIRDAASLLDLSHQRVHQLLTKCSA